MLDTQQIKRIDPETTAHLNEEELEILRQTIYEAMQLAFEAWNRERLNSNKPKIH